MENEESDKLGKQHVPSQYKGSEMNAVEKAVLGTNQEAVNFFEVVKERLLDVNNWGKIAKLPLSSFRLTNSRGEEINRHAREGDYMKIDIPGPGTETGGGFDWVMIESILSESDQDSEYVSIRVRPVDNPSAESTDTAHFLDSGATSTFQVKRIGETVYAEEHGRNEVPNTETGKVIDNIRNTMVGWGAKLGLSYPQWKSLVKGLVNQDQ